MYTENDSKVGFWLRWLCSTFFVFTRALCLHNGRSLQTKNLRSRLAKFPTFESFSVYFIFLLLISTFVLPEVYPKNHSAAIAQAVDNISSSQCYFVPPENWEIADPKTLSPKVQIAFLTKSVKGFCPSINLAIEETDASLNDYLKAVKAIHEQDRNNQWRSLGKVRTAAGLGQLTEVDTKTEWGAVRILQLILIKDKHAYVLTAAALKEEMSNYYKEIQSAFRSFTISNDLFENVPQLDRRETLKQNQSALLPQLKKICVPRRKTF